MARGTPMDETLESITLNGPAKQTLRAFVDGLRSQGGENLRAVVLYGGAAAGRFVPDQSDLNVLIVFGSAHAEALRPLAAAMRTAWRRDRIDPFIVAEGEMAAAAADFPLKFLDIQRSHVVLHGDDMLADLHILRADTARRLRQELRNLRMRMLRRFVVSKDIAVEAPEALRSVTVSLAVHLSTMMGLEGRGDPPEPMGELFDRAAAEFGLDRQVLASLERLRAGEAPADPAALFAHTMDLVDAGLKRAEGLAR